MNRKEDFIFHWRAKLTDGTIISQFDEDGNERSFREVQEREDELVYFYLELQNSHEPFNVGVDLVDGAINFNDFTIRPMKGDISWGEFNPEFRVVNFRRVRRHFTVYGDVGTPEIDYFIGWQTTHEGKNYQKLLKIGSDGSFAMN